MINVKGIDLTEVLKRAAQSHPRACVKRVNKVEGIWTITLYRGDLK